MKFPFLPPLSRLGKYPQAGFFYKDLQAFRSSQSRTGSRKVLKLVLLIGLNCSDRKTAFRAMRNELRDEGLYRSDLNLSNLMDQFAQKHKPISHYLYSGVGLELQFLESKVTEFIISQMTDSGIPVLNIHDGNIVQAKHEEKLRGSMEKGFLINGLKSIPKIKKEY